ncbi:MAG: FtsX-like permease family protein [Candidatus Hodarchaeota archaeon]
MRMYGISFRGMRKRRTRAVLTMICILIGVTVFSGTNVAADGIQHAYVSQLLETVGDVDIDIRNATWGTIEDINEVIAQVESVEGVQAASPRITETQSFENNGTSYQFILLAFDPVEDGIFGEIDPQSAIEEMHNNNCLINDFASERYNLTTGDTINLIIMEYTPLPILKKNVTLHIRAVVNVTGKFSGGWISPTVLLDLATAQQIYDMQGGGNYIAVKVRNVLKVGDIVSRIENSLGSNYWVYSQKEQILKDAEANVVMVRVAMSVFAGISLAVTAVLIVNVMLMNVTERKRELGILRAIGASRSQIFRLVLFETTVYGIIGSLIGAIFGILLSTLMLQIASQTFANLVSLGEIQLIINPFTLLLSFGVGMLFVTIGAIYPAYSAARIDVLGVIRPRMGGVKKQKVSKSMVLGGIILIVTGYFLLASFGLDLMMTLLMIPVQLTVTAMVTAGLILAFGGALYYVAKGIVLMLRPLVTSSQAIIERNVSRNRRRTGLTFTMITIGLVFVVFFSSLSGTLLATFSSAIKIFVGSDIRISTSETTPFAYDQTIESISGIYLSSPFVHMGESLSNHTGFYVGMIFVNASKYHRIVEQFTTLKGPPTETAFNQLLSNNMSIIISDDLADNRSIEVGDSLWITVWVNLTQIPVEFKVVATTNSFYGFPQYMFEVPGYTDTFGVYASLETLAELFNITQARDFMVRVENNVDSIEVAEDVENRLGLDFTNVGVISSEERELLIGDIVGQFMNILYLFVGFALAVAALGMTTSMIVSVTERKREIAILKAVGMSRGQVMKMIMGEAIAITIIGVAVGIIGGLLLWYLFLSQVVWQSSIIFFPMPFVIPLETIVIATVICISIALGASFYPARKAMALEIVEAMRK